MSAPGSTVHPETNLKAYRLVYILLYTACTIFVQLFVVYVGAPTLNSGPLHCVPTKSTALQRGFHVYDNTLY